MYASIFDKKTKKFLVLETSKIVNFNTDEYVDQGAEASKKTYEYVNDDGKNSKCHVILIGSKSLFYLKNLLLFTVQLG